MAENKLKTQSLKLKTTAKVSTKAASSSVSKTVKKDSTAKAPVAEKAPKLSVSVFGLDGVKNGTVSLSSEIFGAKINPELMSQAVRVYLVNQRQGTQNTKSRGEVQGSTRKIYRQKGTGRARHGAITAPIFVGGGIAFGPKSRDFELKLSKQMKKKSLFSALSSKLSQDQVMVVDVSGATGKTKEIYKMFGALKLVAKKTPKILFISDEEKVMHATRNIKSLDLEPAHAINTYSVLNSNYVVITKEALPKMEKAFLGEK